MWCYQARPTHTHSCLCSCLMVLSLCLHDPLLLEQLLLLLEESLQLLLGLLASGNIAVPLGEDRQHLLLVLLTQALPVEACESRGRIQVGNQLYARIKCLHLSVCWVFHISSTFLLLVLREACVKHFCFVPGSRKYVQLLFHSFLSPSLLPIILVEYHAIN